MFYKKNLADGFTLLELSIAIAAFGLIGSMWVSYEVNKNRQHRQDQLQAQTSLWMDAMVNYRMDVGEWPDEINACANAAATLTAGGDPYVTGVPAQNIFGNALVFACNQNEAFITQSVTNDAAALVGKLPNTVLAGVGQVTTRLQASSADAAMDNIFVTDGSHVMRGDTNFGGNDIVDVSNVIAQNVNVTNQFATNEAEIRGDLLMGELVDANDPLIRVDPSGTTRLTNLAVSGLEIGSTSVEGGSCVAGEWGKDSVGSLRCKAGVFARPSADFVYTPYPGGWWRIIATDRQVTWIFWADVDAVLPAGVKLVEITATCEISNSNRNSTPTTTVYTPNYPSAIILQSHSAGGDDSVLNHNTMLKKIGSSRAERRIGVSHSGGECNNGLEVLITGYVE